MPQRTRKEKETASERRQYRIIMRDQAPAPTPHPTPEQPQITQPPREDAPIKKYLLADLRKSLFIITAIFALEILLYFVSIGYQS